MSLLSHFFAAGPAAVALCAAAGAASLCVQRESITFWSDDTKTTKTSEHTLWSWAPPGSPDHAASVHKFNLLVQRELEMRQRAAGRATRTPEDAALFASQSALRIVRNVAPLPLALLRGASETFIVPHGAIDGTELEYGKGGLKEAWDNDIFFYNRLCRYRQ